MVDKAGPHVNMVVIPKVNRAADVDIGAALLMQIEAAVRLTKRIGNVALIETAVGMLSCDAIAAACPKRMEGVVFGWPTTLRRCGFQRSRAGAHTRTNQS